MTADQGRPLEDDAGATKTPAPAGWPPDERRFKVFVSYSRGDSAGYAQQLVAALEEFGLAAKLDSRDLEFGEVWQAQLKDFIRQADAILYVVSPRSIASKWCRWELAQVAGLSKRLVPVVHIPVESDLLPAEIGDVQLFQLKPDADFKTADEYAQLIARLAAGLQKDRAWLEEHTRLTEQAYTWAKEGKSRDHLLWGKALRNAEAWMARRPSGAPPPSQPHLDFITASQTAAQRRGRLRMAGLSAVTALAVAGGLFSWQQKRIAVEERDKVLAGESTFLADQARQRLGEGDATGAINLAIEALPPPEDWSSRPFVTAAEKSLLAATYRRRELFRTNLPKSAELVTSKAGALGAFQDRDGRIAVLSTVTGQVIGRLGRKPHELRVHEFDAEGRTLLTTDNDAVQIWTAGGLRERESIRIGPDQPMRAAFCPDEARIAVLDSNGVVHVMEGVPRKETVKFATEAAYGELRCSSDGRTLVTSGGLGSSLDLWQSADGKRLAWKEGCLACLFDLSPDGSRFLVYRTGEEDPPQLLDIAKGAAIELAGHKHGINAMFFTSDGKWVVTAGDDGTARIWSAQDGKEGARLEGHAGAVVAASARVSASGELRVLTGGIDGTARLWDGATGRQLTVLTTGAPLLSVSYEPVDPELDAEEEEEAFVRALTADTDGRVRVWSVGNAAAPEELYLFKAPAKKLERADFNGTFSSVVARGQSGDFAIWTIRSAPGAFGRLEAVSADGSLAATTSFGKIRVLKMDADEPVAVLQRDGDKGIVVRAVAFSPDKARLLAIGPTGPLGPEARAESLRVWDLGNASLSKSFDGLKTIIAVAASADGRLIAALGEKKIVILDWSLTPLRELPLERRLRQLALSADGSLLAAAGSESAVHLWKVSEGEALPPLGEEERSYDRLAFSPAGDKLVAVSDSRVVHSWQLATRAHRSSEPLAKQIILAELGFDPSGKRIVFGNVLLDAATLDVLMTGSDRDGHILSPRLSPRGGLVLERRRLVAEPFFTDAEALARHAREAVQACLAPEERRPPLSEAPPRWCITGPEAVGQRDRTKWQGKPPYDTQGWRDWLAAHDRGETPALPKSGDAEPPPKPPAPPVE